MEGVTDPVFRALVLGLHRPEDLGGAFTEFLRISTRPLREKDILRHVGQEPGPIPVGLQFMGSDPAMVAESARAAVRAGVPIVDLNFGCPAKGALRGCAGSSLLQDPAGVEAMVRWAADAVHEESAGKTPLSAKIRAGYDDAERVEDLARAVEAGGADLLTIHCRTRAEHYQDIVHWSRIERAVAAVSIPVCGNGGVLGHGDLERMRQETGCRYVMIGRAALGDPWIFAGKTVSRPSAAEFLVRYGQAMQASGKNTRRGSAGRIKQLLRTWTAGDLFADEDERCRWMRESDPEPLYAWLEAQLESGSSSMATS
ncbi:MAG: tRNA-dihydrouridine synthase family protein [Planctomycetota bacterium]